MSTPTTQSSPWFHHFWPWFIVLLLGISVIASLYTVSIAYGLGNLELPAETSAGPESTPPPIDSGAALRTPVR